MKLLLTNFFIGLFLVVAPAVSSAGEGGGVQDYRLSIGDRVKLTVFGEPELSEELVIDRTGNIQLPLVGPALIGDKTVAEAHDIIISRFKEGVLKNPLISLRPVELRPIYILGDVRNSGQYQFRFGLSVLNAIAVAGGFGTEVARKADAEVALLALQERLGVLQQRYVALLIRRARVLAEWNGNKSFPPPEMPQQFAEINVSELIQSENERMASATRSYENIIDILEKQKPTILREIQARKEEIVSIEQLIALNKDQLEKISPIKLASRILEIQSQVAQNQGLISRLRGEIAALEEKFLSVELRIEDAASQRRDRILKERSDVDEQLREVKASLPAVAESIQVRVRQVGAALVDDGDWRSHYDISLVRSRTGDVVKVSAIETVEVEPGDTVLVKLIKAPNELAQPLIVPRPTASVNRN